MDPSQGRRFDMQGRPMMRQPVQQGPSCAFAAPPPKRCYCQPAAFSSLDGRGYQRILDAYGNSRPCDTM